ncbi:MAG: hypothetical protein QOG20_2342 [Pseudonocardiales bacterium]|nr:hypothetical protein [Pseudonocardiales bacterium]
MRGRSGTPSVSIAAGRRASPAPRGMSRARRSSGWAGAGGGGAVDRQVAVRTDPDPNGGVVFSHVGEQEEHQQRAPAGREAEAHLPGRTGDARPDVTAGVGRVVGVGSGRATSRARCGAPTGRLRRAGRTRSAAPERSRRRGTARRRPVEADDGAGPRRAIVRAAAGGRPQQGAPRVGHLAGEGAARGTYSSVRNRSTSSSLCAGDASRLPRCSGDTSVLGGCPAMSTER